MESVGTAEMARRMKSSPEKLREMVDAGDVRYVPVGRKFTFIPEHVFEDLERKKEVAKRTGRSERARRARRKVF